MPEPMTDDEFANIASIYEGIAATSGATLTRGQADVLKLLTEVKRLRAERAAMLDVIEAVQAAVATEVDDGAVYCRSCGSWADADTCLAAGARTKIARVYDLMGDDDAC